MLQARPELVADVRSGHHRTVSLAGVGVDEAGESELPKQHERAGQHPRTGKNREPS